MLSYAKRSFERSEIRINVNSRIDFVFAQKNAVRCIGEQNKNEMIINNNGLFTFHVGRRISHKVCDHLKY